jgi:hypothetical protein
MSTIVEESFNRGLDFLEEPQSLDPPLRMLSPSRVSHAMGLADFLYDPQANTGQVVMRTEDGRKVFDGYLHRLVPDDLRIRERAVFSAPAARASRWLARRPRRVPGIVHFKGGDLVIEHPLELESGGIVAADGSIVVAAPVRVKPYGKPLSLVALDGDVVIKTPGAIEASLVALSGTIVKDADRPIFVRGSVAVNHLDYGAICRSSGHGKIVYDARLDPTVGAGSRRSTYAVHLSPSRAQYAPPAE